MPLLLPQAMLVKVAALSLMGLIAALRAVALTLEHTPVIPTLALTLM